MDFYITQCIHIKNKLHLSSCDLLTVFSQPEKKAARVDNWVVQIHKEQSKQKSVNKCRPAIKDTIDFYKLHALCLLSSARSYIKCISTISATKMNNVPRWVSMEYSPCQSGRALIWMLTEKPEGGIGLTNSILEKLNPCKVLLIISRKISIWQVYDYVKSMGHAWKNMTTWYSSRYLIWRNKAFLVW